jgi:hypothetical protein
MWTLPGKWVVRVWPAKIEDVSIPNVDITNEHWIWMCLRKGHRTNNSLLRGGSHHVTTKDRGFNWKKVRYQCCHSWRKQHETTKCARFWKWVILPNQSSNHIRPWPSAIFRFGSLQIDSMDWFKGGNHGFYSEMEGFPVDFRLKPILEISWMIVKHGETLWLPY